MSSKPLGGKSWLFDQLLKNQDFLSLSDYSFPCFSLLSHPSSCHCILTQYSSFSNPSSCFSVLVIATSALFNFLACFCFSCPWFAVFCTQYSVGLDKLIPLQNLQVSSHLLMTPDVRLLPWLVPCCTSASSFHFLHFQSPFCSSHPS